MKLLLWFVLLTLSLVQPAKADDRSSAEKILRKEIQGVLELINEKNMAPGEKRTKIMEIVNTAFDFPLIAKLTLGKKVWPTFSRKQKKEFIELFSRQLENTYYNEIQFFSDEEIIFEKPRQVKRKVHILTKVFQKDKIIKVLYKMYKTGGKWKVYDAEIQGVSIISSYRAQYREFLRRDTVDNFIKKLRSKNSALSS